MSRDFVASPGFGTPVPVDDLRDRIEATMDRSSPVPLYFQVAQALQRAIESGELPPGTMLTNEVELASALGLSRPTVRQALAHLSDRGLLIRRRGIGTQVVEPKVRRPLELTSLFDDLTDAGRKPRTDVLSLDVATAPAEAAQALSLAPGEAVTKLVRLRWADTEPLALMTNYIPVRLVTLSANDLATAGLYQLLRRSGLALRSADEVIGARNATAKEATQLHERRGAALLTMERAAFDDRGGGVEYGSHVYVASRYSLKLSLLAGR